MAKWEARWVSAAGTNLDIGALAEAGGVHMSAPRRVSAPERRAVMAQSADGDGDDPVTTQYGNRQVVYPLRINCATQAELFAAQASIMAAVGEAKNRRGGLVGELIETPPDGNTITWDVAGIEVGDMETASPFSPGFQDFDITFDVKPLARLDPVTVSLTPTVATDPVLIYDLADIAGDHAALGALTLTDTASQKRRWVAWGLARIDASLQLLFGGESMSMLNGSTAAAGPAGAHGAAANKVLQNLSVPTSWTELGSIGSGLQHVGVYRVFARVQVEATNVGAMSWRLHTYGANTNAYLPNTGVSVAKDGAWHIVDLGEVSLPDAVIGMPSWEGRIAAKAAAATDNGYLDWVALVPATDGWGEVEALDASGDGAILSGKALLIRWDSVAVQQTSTGWDEPGEQRGDPLIVPPGDSRLVVLRSRGKRSLAEGDAGSTDALSATLSYHPRVLELPPT